MATTSPRRIVIFDSNAVIHRAYHALPPFTTKAGVQVNAVYGYAGLLLKVLFELSPDKVLASFDVAGKTFRHEKYELYKAQRKEADQALYDQIPLVHKLVEGLGIPILELKGYEADDIIGTIARQVDKIKGAELIIVTGDMDAMQLIQDGKVKVYALRRGVTDTLLYDEALVQEKYQITPDQVRDFKGLKGDSSDNIPGVPGIGDKRAVSLLAEFGTLEDLYLQVDAWQEYSDVPKALSKVVTKAVFGNLKQYRDQAFFSKELATIDQDIPLDITIEDLPEYRLDQTRAKHIFTQFEFFSLIKRLSIKEQDKADQSKSQSNLLGVVSNQSKTWKEVQSVSDLEKPHALYLDQDQWVLVDGKSRYSVTDQELIHILKDPTETLVMYESKPIWKWSLIHGIEIKATIEDLSVMAYLIQPGERNYDLETLCLVRSLAFDPERPYQWLVNLYQDIQKTLEQKSLNKVYGEIERPLIPVLARMELAGVYLDTKYLAKIKQKVDVELEQLIQHIYAMAGGEFNLNSPRQVSEVLFDRLGVSAKGLRKTSSGHISTSAEILERLAPEHEIIGHMLKYRELSKLKSTYIEVLPKLTDSRGRIHTTYSQTIAATGRLSSIDPNLQNIPVRSELGREIRKAFRATKGKTLISCDYSQIELRLAAHLSGDLHMQEIFRAGTDFHTATAARVYQVSEDQVTKEMRSFAKVINFGILYGMGVNALARNLSISRSEAQEFLAKYREAYPKLHTYIESQKDFALKHGYAITEYGRIRDLSGYDQKNPQMKALLERIAVNMPIQGLQADIIKLAMIRIDKEIHDQDDITMLLQIHDELIFEVDESRAASYAPQIKTWMESVYQASVPIIADPEIMEAWE